MILEAPARLASGHPPELVRLSRPHSNFAWVFERFNRLDALQRILSQMRFHRAQTMFVEELRAGAAFDLTQEDEDIRKRHPGFAVGRTYRLSFFRGRVRAVEALNEVEPRDVLGYALVKRDEIPGLNEVVVRVYESVIRPNAHKNNFTRGQQNWSFRVGASIFTVAGYLYAQQNGVTNCCAHAALRTVAARFHPDGDMSYREMNELVDVDHVHRKIGGPDGGGLESEEVLKILKHAGAKCYLADYSKPHRTTPPPYQRYLYGSIESGYPAILYFSVDMSQNSGHAIPVFGHTFNQDIWVPSAEKLYFKLGKETRYTPSDAWLSSFLCHDDNLGSNLCVPRHYLRLPPAAARKTVKGGRTRKRRVKVKPNLGAERVAGVIATMPREVRVDPLKAEAIAADFLSTILIALPKADNVWAGRLYDHADPDSSRHGRIVFRTILVQAKEYAQHLSKIRDWEGKRIRTPIQTALQNWPNILLWLVEVSMPELFPTNRRKLGEVVLSAQSFSPKARDFKSFVLARLPGYFALLANEEPSDANSEPRYAFHRSGVDSHVALFGCES